MKSIGCSLGADARVATPAPTRASVVVRNAASRVELDVAALEQQVAQLLAGPLHAGLHP
jgi:hypothetical protein